ncbi:hypothetical protein RFI_18034 [Reticulomyxa filosa]|uniref:PNPLA domain-containing protein n=1 Tax=Reticulomyxa filosa TaxID=46433 RepID=X6MYS3_RETFI|nr:hypothetical protein RFI_18034 [Reticulomyxa filosa]|eukprot:ETO19195.1 hypothetical protein RFI_18034 [Reticulomyxa filosa]
MAVGYIRRKKQEQKVKEYFAHKPVANKPLLSFSGAGLLAFYFQGVCAYLQDHFDLTNVRFAGISAGSCSAAGLASHLPVKASVVFGLRWLQVMKTQGIYFIDPQTLVDMGYRSAMNSALMKGESFTQMNKKS